MSTLPSPSCSSSAKNLDLAIRSSLNKQQAERTNLQQALTVPCPTPQALACQSGIFSGRSHSCKQQTGIGNLQLTFNKDQASGQSHIAFQLEVAFLVSA